MDLTKRQVMAFAEVMLGYNELGDNSSTPTSPMVRAFLDGAMPEGAPSGDTIGNHLRNVNPVSGDNERHLADFLEAAARVLRNPTDPIMSEDLVRCESCGITAHHEDAPKAGWGFSPEDGIWCCPRCGKK